LKLKKMLDVGVGRLAYVQPATTAEGTNNCLVSRWSAWATRTGLPSSPAAAATGELAQLALVDGVDLRKVSCSMNDGCATAKLAAMNDGCATAKRLGDAYGTTLAELARRGELAQLALADEVDLRKVSCSMKDCSATAKLAAMNDGCATAKLAAPFAQPS
jgi:hypothetical protein